MIERTYRVNDVIKSEFLRLPLTLLANPKYKAMSLEAKFIYSLLLNRITLSQRNDWINEDNEVYLIYTREEAASTLNISPISDPLLLLRSLSETACFTNSGRVLALPTCYMS